MPGTNTAAIPFTVYKVIGGAGNALPLLRRLPEAASKTFNYGVPVVSAAGYIQESATISSSSVAIAGVSQQAGDNLATAGTAPVGGSSTTYGSVPNQVSAVNIPMGAPMVDGNCGVLLAADSTIFVGVVDAAHTTTATDLGSIFGLTKDSTTNNWFVDTTISAASSGACVEVTDFVDPVGTGLNGNTTTTTGGRVGFRFTHTFQQFFT
jgi:hypothetical protein